MINITSFKDPKSSISEAYRTIRTNIQFSKVDKDIQTILITSSKQDEGKTTVISNLAVSFSLLEGKKVLLIDADLRNPSIHRMFNVSNGYGLTEVLAGQKELKACVQMTEISNLQILTTGKMPPNPAEMLASKKMREFIDILKDYYDYIFIDAPPIGVITDAGILANYCDGTIMVIGAGETEIEATKITKERLEKVKANIMGVVLNKYVSEGNYYGYYSYYYEQADGSRSAKHKKKKRKKSKNKEKAYA
ncbi:CpsD/CapB family tyrosine-protein kinase [Paraclostridium bifermentans]|uniref:CpsD/CapB family tyrosine-protein kinase n=1 Tax=Paraclostridium bifermentans TaxID=1490 RepID=UPI00359CAF47